MQKTISSPPGARQQKGVTLVEALAGLAIMSGVMIGAANMTSDYLEQSEASTAALQSKSFGEAARLYIADNRATITLNALPNRPCLISSADIAPYLQGVTGVNTYGQTLSVLVKQSAIGDLEPMVVTSGGSYVLEDGKIALVVGAIGAEGGGVYATDPNAIRGAGGGWNIDLSSAPGSAYRTAPVSCLTGAATAANPLSAGSFVTAIWFSTPLDSAPYLYRHAVGGRPDLNAMNTPLIMNSTQIDGAVCATTGAIARNASASLLVCRGGTWNSVGSTSWRDAVPSYADLAAIVSDPIGAVRMTIDTARAFMWNGASWSPLAADQNGNLTIPGSITAANGRVLIGNDVTGNGKVRVVGANNVGVSVVMRNGRLRLLDNTEASEVAAFDAATGQVSARDFYSTTKSRGLNTVIDRMPNYASMGGYVVVDGSTVAKPSCGPGGSPRIFVIPHNIYLSGYDQFNAYATDNGTYWTVSARSYYWGGSASGSGLAVTNCYY